MNNDEKEMLNLDIKSKIGQLSQNLYGWECFTKNGKEFSSTFKNELNKYGTIGTIYGLLRSDPWSKVNFKTGIDPKYAAKYLNNFQKEIMKNSQIPALFSEEIPHGHQGLNATVFPVNLAIGSSFNRELYQDVCAAIAKELSSKGAHLGLISCLDLALDPRWGRSEECYGEDTYLSMKMAKSAVFGLQGHNWKIGKNKIGAVVKHFIAQGSTTGGYNGKSVSIGANELKTHHLPIMQACIDANVVGCMAAYNDIDGIACHNNKKLLIDELRIKMGYKGFVMSDGCAIDNLSQYMNSDEEVISSAIKSGVDMDLWNKTFNSLYSAFQQKTISEREIDIALINIYNAKLRLNLFKKPFKDENAYEKIDFHSHHNLAEKIAEESIVLLKNNKELLPLKNFDETCLIGPVINNAYHHLGDYTAFQNLDVTKSFNEVFNIPSAKGCHIREKDKNLLKSAVELAKKSKQVIMILGSSSARNFNTEFDPNGSAINMSEKSEMDCGENVDVSEIRLNSAQQELFSEIKKVNTNIILVISSGRPIGIEKEAKVANAVIQTWYSGMRGPQALKNTILGINNPSGRLSITIPKNSSQLPVYYWLRDSGKYLENNQNEPLYKFGAGLSYSNFIYKNITVKETNCKYKKEVHLNIINASNKSGKRTILVFAKISGTIIKPPKTQLVAFKKIFIESNSHKNIIINIDMFWLYKNYQFTKVELNIK